jgi:hypothetical protein
MIRDAVMAAPKTLFKFAIVSPSDVFFDHPIGFVGMSIKLRAKTQLRDG